MAIEAEALKALSEKASQGEWRHCQPFMSVPAENTVHGRLPAQRVDYVSTWPGLGTPPGHRVIIPMEGRECHTSSDDMAFIAALVSAYRDGSLIHRSALAEDTARAAEGWQPIETAPKDGTEILLGSYPQTYEGKPVPARVTLGYWTQEEDLRVEVGDCGGECRCPEYRFDDPYWMSSDGGFSKENPATHWRPLPAPPALPLAEEAAR